MKIQVSSKNEFKIIPDVWDNLTVEENEQFAVYMKKLTAMASGDWSVVTLDDNQKADVEINMREKLRLSIIRFENAPTLSVDEGVEMIELTPEILCGGKFNHNAAIEAIESCLLAELNRMDLETGFEAKK